MYNTLKTFDDIKNSFKSFKELYQHINEMCETYVSEFARYGSFQSWSFEDNYSLDRIAITVDTSCRGCYDTDTFYIPTEYIWDPDWVNTERKKQTEANLKALAEKAERERKEAAQLEQQQYKTYLSLKDKYEGASNGNNNS